MTKNNKCLFISLAVSLVLIIVGVVMFSVLGGFNDDGFTKDKTVITVTGDPIVTVREDFRNDLDELCKTTLEDAGAKVGGGRYLELSSLHVSQELRGQGVGKKLLHAAVQWARGQGAKRLYISAHPAVESQAFYRAMGCTPAQVCRPAHAGRGPAGRPLELLL